MTTTTLALPNRVRPSLGGSATVASAAVRPRAARGGSGLRRLGGGIASAFAVAFAGMGVLTAEEAAQAGVRHGLTPLRREAP